MRSANQTCTASKAVPQARDDARASLFDYMEVFYNRQRRHSSISYEAPLPFEAMKSPVKVSTVRG